MFVRRRKRNVLRGAAWSLKRLRPNDSGRVCDARRYFVQLKRFMMRRAVS
jgi:hypothetical protein